METAPTEFARGRLDAAGWPTRDHVGDELPAQVEVRATAAQAAHPECEKMHAHGYCLCATVQCFTCDRNHPPHKGCQCL